jgi:hypothetical protein
MRLFGGNNKHMAEHQMTNAASVSRRRTRNALFVLNGFLETLDLLELSLLRDVDARKRLEQLKRRLDSLPKVLDAAVDLVVVYGLARALAHVLQDLWVVSHAPLRVKSTKTQNKNLRQMWRAPLRRAAKEPVLRGLGFR